MKEYVLLSENSDRTFEIGRIIGEIAQSGDVFALIGDLGVGKTVLVKGIAKGLQVEEDPNSPTFVFMNAYEGGTTTLYHFDLYRISGVDDLNSIAYRDYVFSDGVCAIEWADKIPDELPDNAVIIELSNHKCMEEDSLNKRILKFTGSEKWVSLFKSTVEPVLQT